jgi:hypothetical protein
VKGSPPLHATAGHEIGAALQVGPKAIKLAPLVTPDIWMGKVITQDAKGVPALRRHAGDLEPEKKKTLCSIIDCNSGRRATQRQLYPYVLEGLAYGLIMFKKLYSVAAKQTIEQLLRVCRRTSTAGSGRSHFLEPRNSATCARAVFGSAALEYAAQGNGLTRTRLSMNNADDLKNSTAASGPCIPIP